MGRWEDVAGTHYDTFGSGHARNSGLTLHSLQEMDGNEALV